MLLFLQAVAHDFGVETISEIFFPPHKGFFRALFALIENPPRHLSKQTARERQQVVCMGQQQVSVDPRYVIKSMRMCAAGEFGQVVIALLVHSQQRHLKTIVLCRFVCVIPAEVYFTADNGLHLMFKRSTDKLKCPHHVAMIGHGYGRHLHFSSRLDKSGNIRRTLQHTVLRMHMEVYERHFVGQNRFFCGRRFLRLTDRFHRRSRHLKVGSRQHRRLVGDIARICSGITDDAALNKFKKALARGNGIIAGIMRFLKMRIEEFAVQLRQAGPLVLSALATGQRAVVCGKVLGVEHLLTRKLIGLPAAEVLATDDVDVKLHIVTGHVRRLGERFTEHSEGFGERHPFTQGPVGRNAVDLFSIKRDRETFRADKRVVGRNE